MLRPGVSSEGIFIFPELIPFFYCRGSHTLFCEPAMGRNMLRPYKEFSIYATRIVFYDTIPLPGCWIKSSNNCTRGAVFTISCNWRMACFNGKPLR